jgi:hypothetical protein
MLIIALASANLRIIHSLSPAVSHPGCSKCNSLSKPQLYSSVFVC